MKKWLLAYVIFFLTPTSFAQKIKVQKVKGNQAVIEFTSGTLQSGQVYELAPHELSQSYEAESSRNYLLALSFSLLNTKSDTINAENETDISLTGKLGWNYGSFELGPLASFASDSTGSITSNTYKVGAFIDFNVIANAPGEAFLYGIGGTGSLGQLESSGLKRDLIDFFVGPFIKWFPSGNRVGIRIDAGYIYQKQSGGIGTDTTVTGLATNVDILTYF